MYSIYGCDLTAVDADTVHLTNRKKYIEYLTKVVL